VFVAVAGRPTVRCQTGSLEALQPALLTGDQRHVLSARGFSIAPSGQTAEREIATADPRWTMREAVFALEVLFEAFQYRTGWLRTSIGH